MPKTPKKRKRVYRVEMSNNPDGVSFWAKSKRPLDNRWIIDASTFLDDFTFRISLDRFEVVASGKDYIEYKFKDSAKRDG